MNSKGFIALFSVIIISFVLLLMTVTLNTSGLFGRFNIFDSENKERSANLAYACIESARLAIAGENYTNGVEVDVEIEDEECRYEVNDDTKITAWAEVNNAYTHYYAEIDPNQPDFPVLELKECPDLSPCP